MEIVRIKNWMYVYVVVFRLIWVYGRLDKQVSGPATASSSPSNSFLHGISYVQKDSHISYVPSFLQVPYVILE